MRAVIFLLSVAVMVFAGANGADAQSAEQPGKPAIEAAAAFGPVSDEVGALRMQDWRVPTPLANLKAHARLYRPKGQGPFPLALIAHASTQSPLQRAQMRLPDYRGLVTALIAKGYAVIVPLRPGHGATGGAYIEDQKGCVNADYESAGMRTADSIEAVLNFMRTQSFIRRDGALVIGHSAGGWGALALAARKPRSVARIIVFAPGRGGRAEGVANAMCAEDRLIAAAEMFGKGAKADISLPGMHARGEDAIPVTWIVADNDSYFSPALSRRMADAFASSGAQSGVKVDFRVTPPYGQDGHGLAEAEAGALAAVLREMLK